jgi:hypothetical protein
LCERSLKFLKIDPVTAEFAVPGLHRGAAPGEVERKVAKASLVVEKPAMARS